MQITISFAHVFYLQRTDTLTCTPDLHQGKWYKCSVSTSTIIIPHRMQYIFFIQWKCRKFKCSSTKMKWMLFLVCHLRLHMCFTHSVGKTDDFFVTKKYFSSSTELSNCATKLRQNQKGKNVHLLLLINWSLRNHFTHKYNVWNL